MDRAKRTQWRSCSPAYTGLTEITMGDLVPDTSLKFMRDLLMIVEDLLGWPERLNKNTSAWPSDIQPAITKPLVCIIAGPLRVTLRAGIDRSDIPKDLIGAAVVALDREGPRSVTESFEPVCLKSVLRNREAVNPGP